MATSMNAKKVATPPTTGTTQTTRSRRRRRLTATATAPYAERTSSHKRSDPSWPPQNALSAYCHGRSRLVCAATYEKLKSWRRSALARTIAATTVEPKQARSALRAEPASRRRFARAASAPATSAYTASPRLTTSAERPRSAIYALFLAAYFDGHFVTSPSAKKTPPRSSPSATTSRPDLNRSGTVPWKTTGTVALLRPMSAIANRNPPGECASPRIFPTTLPVTETLPVWPASVLGLTDACEVPTTDV